MVRAHNEFGKIGIVLTGGFLRGAFQVGVLKAFHEHHIIPSYVVGVSVGAINGAAFVAGNVGALWDTYKEIAKRPRKFVYRLNFWTLLRAFFWSKSILVNTPLRKEIIEGRIGLQSIISSPVRLDIITTNFQTGQEVVFSNKIPEHQNPEILETALMASSAMPVVFPPELYKGHQLFDGGIIEKAPITFAIKEGCDTIFVIVNDPLESIESSNFFNNIYAISKRTNKIVGWRTLKKDLERGSEVNQDISEYEKMKSKIVSAIEREGNMILRKEVEDILDDKRLSLQWKRKVTIHILEPDSGLGDGSERLFDYRSIPQYLDNGYAKAVKLLKGINIIS